MDRNLRLAISGFGKRCRKKFWRSTLSSKLRGSLSTYRWWSQMCQFFSQVRICPSRFQSQLKYFPYIGSGTVWVCGKVLTHFEPLFRAIERLPIMRNDIDGSAACVQQNWASSCRTYNELPGKCWFWEAYARNTPYFRINWPLLCFMSNIRSKSRLRYQY